MPIKMGFLFLEGANWSFGIAILPRDGPCELTKSQLEDIIVLPAKRLFEIAKQLDRYADYETPELDSLIEALESVEKSWSGSWRSSESNYYNKNFEPTSEVYEEKTESKNQYGPYGLHYGQPSAEWRKYSASEVERHINEKTGDPSTDRFSEEGRNAKIAFNKARSSVLSFLYENFDTDNDKVLQDWIATVEALDSFSEIDYVESQKPPIEKAAEKPRATKDSLNLFKSKKQHQSVFAALSTGARMSRPSSVKEDIETPPHVTLLAKILVLKHPFESCNALYVKILELGKHLQNIERTLFNEGEFGTRVFIGHGRSQCWRDLKEFLSVRLKLACDDFNRVPTAGLTIPERLKEMLDQASIAFLVMTAEDEQLDGKLHPRMNVIHEVGLFQGKLGLKKAIVLLEDGCEKFSNIHGLVEIRFPKGNIRATFEEIREVMEREGVLD